MQELGNTMNTLSLQDALASVKAAKDEIARLTAAAETARSNYQECKQSVDAAKRYSTRHHLLQNPAAVLT